MRDNTVGTYAEDCDELKGIKRLNIFKYFEDTNILLPIETFHDEKNNTVYAKTDCLGTYCVMDLEVWMQNLGVEPASSSEKTESVQVAYGATKAAETAEDERLNVVFFLDARPSISNKKFNDMRDLIKEVVENTNITLKSGKFKVSVNFSVWIYQGKNKIEQMSLNNKEDIDKFNGLSHTSESGDDIIDVTEFFDGVVSAFGKNAEDQTYKTIDELTLCIMIVDEKNILALSEDAHDVFEVVSKQDNLYISFVSDTHDPKKKCYMNDVISATDGEILNFDPAKLQNYILKFNREEYMIITANNYELVKLDESLIKGSGTDTDYDGAEDWDEVNVDLIYQLKPMSMGKKALLMNDMPTINEIIDYYDQAYVQSGLDRLTRDSLQYSSNPVKGVYRQFVAPIRSNPADADSDNDGIPDNIDVLKLNTANEYNPIENISDVFILIAVMNNDFDINISNDCVVYNLPYDDKYIKKTSFYNGEARVIAIAYSEHCYWLKIKINGFWGFVKAENTDFDISNYICKRNIDTNDIYKSNKSHINVIETEKECCEFYNPECLYSYTHMKFKPLRENYTETLTGNPNECGTAKYYFSYEVQEYIQSVCDTLIFKYQNQSPKIDDKTVSFLKKYLTPELIMAIGSVETGWVKKVGNKTGIASCEAIPNCIGGENASIKLEDYDNLKDTVAASAVAIAHYIYEQLNGGWSNVYGNNYNEDGTLNEGQVLYNALYSYGNTTRDGYSYMEAAVSSAHKLYRYGSFCKQRKGFTMIDTSEDAINEYANNEWLFEIIYISNAQLQVTTVDIND